MSYPKPDPEAFDKQRISDSVDSFALDSLTRQEEPIAEVEVEPIVEDQQLDEVWNEAGKARLDAAQRAFDRVLANAPTLTDPAKMPREKFERRGNSWTLITG